MDNCIYNLGNCNPICSYYILFILKKICYVLRMIFRSTLGVLTVEINTSETWKNVFIVNYICFLLIVTARLSEGKYWKMEGKSKSLYTFFLPCFPELFNWTVRNAFSRNKRLITTILFPAELYIFKIKNNTPTIKRSTSISKAGRYL